MAVAAIRRAAEVRGLPLTEARVAVVGARGSVGALGARLLARERPHRLLLVGNPVAGRAALLRLERELARDGCAVTATTDLGALADCDIVFTATAAARPILDDAVIAPWTIICDVARPPDTSSSLRRRHDVTIIDGGRVALPDPETRFGIGNLQNLPAGVTLACLAETILLALDGETRDRGIGDDVALEEVDEVLLLAERHGFRLAPPVEPRVGTRLLAGRPELCGSPA
jgi:predicted amino acid dehydrogenase